MKQQFVYFLIITSLLVACGLTFTEVETSPMLTSTLKPIPSLEKTSSVSENFLPTAYPTLIDELREQFYMKLTANGDCELPCFLGIKPGDTSLSDATFFLETYDYDRKIFVHTLNFYAPNQWHVSNVSVFNDERERKVSFSLYLQSKRDLVSGLIINFGPILRPDKTADPFDTLLVRYGIVELFHRHGVPSVVFLNPPHTRQTQSAYSLEVVYDDQKILARYSGTARVLMDEKYQLCPAIGDGDVDSFTIALGNPSDDLNIIELAWGSFVSDFDLVSYGSDLIKLNPQTLYSLFMEQGERCFYEDEYRLQ
jgi:hypothetical protein